MLISKFKFANKGQNVKKLFQRPNIWLRPVFAFLLDFFGEGGFCPQVELHFRNHFFNNIQHDIFQDKKSPPRREFNFFELNLFMRKKTIFWQKVFYFALIYILSI